MKTDQERITELEQQVQELIKWRGETDDSIANLESGVNDLENAPSINEGDIERHVETLRQELEGQIEDLERLIND